MNPETLVAAYKSFERYKACLNKLGIDDECDMEDIFHDSIVRLNEYRDCEVRNVDALLYRIVYTKAMEHHRKKVVTASVEDMPDGSAVTEPEYYVDGNEHTICGKRVENLIRNLTDREKDVLHKYVMEGKSFKTVSAEIGISEVNARVIWHRTKGKLKTKLKHN